jgi:hypothetical protein
MEKTNLKYEEHFELSPCAIIKDTECGLAILSKYPINGSIKELFTNPKLSKTTSSGNTYYTYDKGFLIANIVVDNQIIVVLTHHGFPYRRFNSTPEDNPKVFNFFDEVIVNSNVDIVTGDFNAEDFLNLLPKTSNIYKRTINEITTVDNMKFDDILIHNNIDFSKKIVKLLSDHFIVIDDLYI